MNRSLRVLFRDPKIKNQTSGSGGGGGGGGGGGVTGAKPVPPLSVADMTYTPESKVEISALAIGEADTWEGDTLVLLAFQQEDKEAFAVIAGAGAAAVDEKLGGPALDMVVLEEFKVGRWRWGGRGEGAAGGGRVGGGV